MGGEQIARILLWLIAIGLVLSYIQHGPGGPVMWLRAKFLGRPA